MIIAKYKFNSTLYDNLLPVFNNGYTSYTVTDDTTTETDANGNVIKTRTIESDTLPTYIRFGVDNWGLADNRSNSLIEVLDIDISNVTNLHRIFRACKNLVTVNTEHWNINPSVRSMFLAFAMCEKLTALDVSNWDMSNIEEADSLFNSCSSLTSLDVSNWNVSNVKNMAAIFANCGNLKFVDVSKWDTSSATTMAYLFQNCWSFSTLDVSNFNTSKITNMNTMFGGCSASKLDVSNWDVSSVTNMSNVFANCGNLTSLDLSNWDVSSVTNMENIFFSCTNLTSLDLSNWDVSSVTNMRYAFQNCRNLKKLDLSNWKTSITTGMSNLFYNCNSLVSLDLSNFIINSETNAENMFYGTGYNLTNIGMLYCNKDTINKVASLLGTSLARTIWVEDTPISSLTTYTNITYKKYGQDLSVTLTSPLLEGDKLVVRDGKLCHYHVMREVILDGHEEWTVAQNTDNTTYRFTTSILYKNGVTYSNINTNNLKCDKLSVYQFGPLYQGWATNAISVWGPDYQPSTNIVIAKHEFGNDISKFKVWLSENPVKVVYELAQPYYEVISEDPELIATIASSDINTVTNNAVVSTSMDVRNRALSLTALKPNTKYTIGFDRSNVSSVGVNIGGNAGSTTDSYITLTTPTTLANNELKITGTGTNVSKIKVLEGELSPQAMPMNSFKGLESTFESEYIPENVWKNEGTIASTITYNEANNEYSTTTNAIQDIRTLNLSFVSDKITLIYDIKGSQNINVTDYNSYFRICVLNGNTIAGFKGNLTTNYQHVIQVVNVNSNSQYRLQLRNTCSIKNIVILEGDWKLNPLTYDEVTNHANKYKVEYKSHGKNLVGIHSLLDITYPYNHLGYNVNNIPQGVYFTKDEWYDSNDRNFDLQYDGTNIICGTTNASYKGITVLCKLKPNTNYTLSYTTSITVQDSANNAGTWYQVNANTKRTVTFTTNSRGTKEFIVETMSKSKVMLKEFQIEEGSTATDFQPYVETTKTYYLNSPLLPGDTLEEINGVMNHVHRSEKVVLNGNQTIESGYVNTYSAITNKMTININNEAYYPSNVITIPNVYSDKLITKNLNLWANIDEISVSIDMNGNLPIRLPKSYGDTASVIRSNLALNPITVVYQLANPVYEPISDCVLLDGYANGTLSYETNTPVSDITLQPLSASISYLEPNKVYTLQFTSTNSGTFDLITVGGQSVVNSTNPLTVVPGKNKLTFTTSDTVSTEPLLISGKGCRLSDISVVQTELDYDHFMGLKSTFEEEKIELLNIDMDNWTWITAGGKNRWQLDGSKVSDKCITLYNNTDKVIRVELNSDRTSTLGTFLSVVDLAAGTYTVVDNQTKFIRTIQGLESNGWTNSDSDKAKLANILVAEGDYSNHIEDMLHNNQYKAELVSYNAPIRFGACGSKQ